MMKQSPTSVFVVPHETVFVFKDQRGAETDNVTLSCLPGGTEREHRDGELLL